MIPAVPPNANVVYSKPIDWDEAVDGECGDLHAIRSDGRITTFWSPDAAELKALNEGGFVMIALMASNLPPLAVGAAVLKKAELAKDGLGA